MHEHVLHQLVPGVEVERAWLAKNQPATAEAEHGLSASRCVLRVNSCQNFVILHAPAWECTPAAFCKRGWSSQQLPPWLPRSHRAIQAATGAFNEHMGL